MKNEAQKKAAIRGYELKLGQEQFVAAIRRFLEVQVLTRPLLQELIDHIDVFETEGVGKSRTQRVAVYYRFVGYIELPVLPTRRHNVKADTRQGVSVEYVPQIAAQARPWVRICTVWCEYQ